MGEEEHTGEGGTEETAHWVMEEAQRYASTVQQLIEFDERMQHGVGLFLESFPPSLRPNVLMFAQIFGALLMGAAIRFKVVREATKEEKAKESDKLERMGLGDIDLGNGEEGEGGGIHGRG